MFILWQQQQPLHEHVSADSSRNSGSNIVLYLRSVGFLYSRWWCSVFGLMFVEICLGAACCDCRGISQAGGGGLSQLVDNSARWSIIILVRSRWNNTYIKRRAIYEKGMFFHVAVIDQVGFEVQVERTLFFDWISPTLEWLAVIFWMSVCLFDFQLPSRDELLPVHLLLKA